MLFILYSRRALPPSPPSRRVKVRKQQTVHLCPHSQTRTAASSTYGPENLAGQPAAALVTAATALSSEFICVPSLQGRDYVVGLLIGVLQPPFMHVPWLGLAWPRPRPPGTLCFTSRDICPGGSDADTYVQGTHVLLHACMYACVYTLSTLCY